MKKWIILILLFCLSKTTLAQISHTTYVNKNNHSKLILSDHGFFHYQTYDGIFYRYLRGKWKIDNKELILSESYYGDINENMHFIYKAPKFEYTIGKRITTFKIDENQLILTHQENTPKNAGFHTNFEGNFLLIKE